MKGLTPTLVAAALAASCAYHTPVEPTVIILPSPTVPASIALGAVSGTGANAGTATIIAAVQNADGGRIPKTAVDFVADAGTLSVTHVITNDNGEAQTVLTASAATTVHATAGSVTRQILAAIQPAPPNYPPAPPPVIPPPPPPPSPLPPPAPSYGVTMTPTPNSVVSGGSVTLSATATPQNGAPTPASFAWDCDGNGTVDFTTTTSSQACTYPTVGTFSPKVTVTGGAAVGVGSATVTVTAQPVPVVTVNCNTVTWPSITSCNVSATLNGAAVPSSNITNVDWDFGDTGTATTSNNLAMHAYAAPGTYTVVVSNVTVTGTTAKGSGSTSVKVN